MLVNIQTLGYTISGLVNGGGRKYTKSKEDTNKPLNDEQGVYINVRFPDCPNDGFTLHDITSRKYWYCDEDIRCILSAYYEKGNHQKVYVTADDGGFSTILDRAFQWIVTSDSPNDHVALIALNVRQSHWVAIAIKLEEFSRGKSDFRVIYNDPLGDPMSKSTKTLLRKVSKRSTGSEHMNIIDEKYELQSNGFDCGPWTIESLRLFAEKGSGYLKDIQSLKGEAMRNSHRIAVLNRSLLHSNEDDQQVRHRCLRFL